MAVQRRLKEKLLRYSQDPLAYAVKLTDQSIGQYRFRVGDYRSSLTLRVRLCSSWQWATAKRSIADSGPGNRDHGVGRG